MRAKHTHFSNEPSENNKFKNNKGYILSMTAITDNRNIMQVEELGADGAVSEGAFSRMGAAVNFIMNKQAIVYMYEYAGRFKVSSLGEGGILNLINNMTVFGIGGRIGVAGSSGSTVIDLHYERAGVDQGSVFSTKITIPNTVSDNGYFWKNIIDANSDASGGITLPVFSTTDFNQGDILRADIDSNAIGARNLIINIFMRPR